MGFQKFILAIVAILLFTPLIHLLMDMFGFPILIGLAGVLLIVWCPHNAVGKRKWIFLILGFFLILLAIFNYLNFLPEYLNVQEWFMGVLPYALAGVGFLVLLAALGKEGHVGTGGS